MSSQASSTSQTAQDYIATQLTLEADAREALPYKFDACTRPLGPLRQVVFACLTCAPSPASKYQQFIPAGICYSCSISCHGEHNLVELFTKRDFVCDCGTTRLSNSGTACSLRLQPSGEKGSVTGDEARGDNRYNQNYEGKFCGCGEEYDPEKEKGTMFQCLGLGTVEHGGCGEDWWHPECLMGLPRRKEEVNQQATTANLETLKEEVGQDQLASNGPNVHAENEQSADQDPEVPPGFPHEDDFDHLICYKCVNAFPWIKRYAGTTGFLPALSADAFSHTDGHVENKKRKADEDLKEPYDSKKVKADDEQSISAEPIEAAHVARAELNADISSTPPMPRHATLPAAPSQSISLFLKEDFRNHLCRCPECFPALSRHPQLLEEEESYEPPLSESDGEPDHVSAGRRSVNSGSLLDRGEAALSSMDRVRAIEGVMAYNHVRDKVKAFLQPFAESGQLVGAEDIKTYFAKLRGDEQAEREARVGAAGGKVQGDGRREQDGY